MEKRERTENIYEFLLQFLTPVGLVEFKYRTTQVNSYTIIVKTPGIRHTGKGTCTRDTPLLTAHSLDDHCRLHAVALAI